MNKKLWRTPTSSDTGTSTPPRGFQLHLSEQVAGHDVNREYIARLEGRKYPTPTASETTHPEMELAENGRRKTGNNNTHSLNLADTVRHGGGDA